MIDLASQRVLAILPCRNEEPSIGPTLRAVGEAMPSADRLVIDDESSDGTARVARAAGARVLPLTVNLGYGAALETGYQYAAEMGYDIVLQLDGDGQHPPSELPKLLQPLLAGEADIVLGSRYLKAGDAFPTSVGRRLGQRLFAAIVNIATRRRFTDPTSGFQALNRDAFGLFGRSGIFPSDYPDADILLTAHLAGLRIVEVPVRMLPRLRGRSMHSTLSSGYYVVKMLFSLFIVFLNREKFRLARSRARS
jgi:glycosyltransferase involved in cell wall biosynthesis